MKPLQHLSTKSLAALLVALTLPVACQQTPSAPSNTGTQTNASNSSQAAVTGVIYTSLAADGRYVPPTSPVSVSIKDPNNASKELAPSVQTDSLGRFYIKNIGVSATNTAGQDVLIDIPDAKYKRTLKVFPGRILNLSAIRLTLVAGNEQTKSISGTLLAPDQSPLKGVTVRDKKFTFRQATTDNSGAFVLDVVGDEIEVLVGATAQPIPITVQEILEKKIINVPIGNVRSFTGTVKDSSNSNIPIDKVRIRVDGTSISTLTDAQGKYTLNGAPLIPFSLEVEPINGYSGKSIQIGPATATSQEKPQVQDIVLQPIGSLQVNFTVESAPDFGQPISSPLGCVIGFNCREYDLNGDGGMENVYHNGLAVLNPLNANINIEGTELKQQVIYPPAAERDLIGTDAEGEIKIFPRAVRDPNVVFSVLFDNVPGGRQNITISMTGMQTQKSINVFVPPRDTISSDLITIFRVKPVFGVGDVTGKLTLIDSKGQEVKNSALLSKIKIAYIDISDQLDFLPTGPSGGALERNSALFGRYMEALSADSRAIRLGSISGQDTNTYYLKNVSTGSRIMVVAGLVDGQTVLEDCFIPSPSVLLNVKPGVINFAPDLTLTLRPLPGCQ